MNADNANAYCLFCLSGHEQKVVFHLHAAGYAALAPQAVRWRPTAAGIRKVTCPMLPGYVFFESNGTPDWQGIQANESVLKVLQYDDGERALRGADAEFVTWLKKYRGIIDISHAIQAGTKLEFVDGPLKDMSAKIVKVNKNRKQVQIALGDEASILRTVWCSIEFIETNTDMTVPRR